MLTSTHIYYQSWQKDSSPILQATVPEPTLVELDWVMLSIPEQVPLRVCYPGLRTPSCFNHLTKGYGDVPSTQKICVLIPKYPVQASNNVHIPLQGGHYELYILVRKRINHEPSMMVTYSCKPSDWEGETEAGELMQVWGQPGWQWLPDRLGGSCLNKQTNKQISTYHCPFMCSSMRFYAESSLL